MTTPARETEQQRLERMADEIINGRRSLTQIRQSVDRLAGRPLGDYSQTDDSGYQTREQVMARLRSIFTNRGVSLSTYTPGTLSGPPAPIIGGPEGAPRPPTQQPSQPAQPPPDPTAEAADKQRRDAYARMTEMLTGIGLGSLAPQVQRWLVEGLSEDEIEQRMRETNEFKTRFPGIVEREKAGKPAISPGEYVAYERNVAQMMRAAGLPAGFYDSNDDFTRFITNDLSLAELGERVTLAANAAFNAPPETRDALAAWGVGPGELTAFWLDPDKAQPLLERKYAAAQLSGTAARSTYGQLDETVATGLVQMGVTDQQAEQGFGALADSRELFQTLDWTEDTIGQQDQISAVFGGNAAARRRIEQRRRERQGKFEGGGGFASGQTGLSGLGDSSA